MLAAADKLALGGTFSARWRPDLGVAAADAALSAADADLPKHCSFAVVGAGWSGAYAAWRLAVDASSVNASSVCVFEANGRVGGRIFSVHGLPSFADLAVDVGGYRFQTRQRLPADLVWSALKLPTQCYDWECAAKCEGTTCYVVKDAFGNNAGYATAIETMLGQVEAAGGPGRQVHLAARLTSIEAAPAAGRAASRLIFAGGRSVTASKVLLNLPSNAIEYLSRDSTLLGSSSAAVRRLLGAVTTIPMVKVYAWYDDAWWSTKLGLMEGAFTAATDGAPLEGRYHDGPQRCVVGRDTAGDPVYSGKKIAYGNCSGALEVYYGIARPYYAKLMPSPLQPLTVATRGTSSLAAAQLIGDVHAALMARHAKALASAGVAPGAVSPPQTVVLANWISAGRYTPGIGRLLGGDLDRALLRKPLPEYDLFLANQDFGYETGWAAGSLAMAEKVLQAELGLPAPRWLDAEWYEKRVVAEP